MKFFLSNYNIMIIRVINQLPTSFRRVVIVVSLLLAAVNVAWGQTVTFSTDAVTREFYLNKGSQTSVDVDVSGKISKICEDLTTATGSTVTPSSLSSQYVMFWGLGDNSGNVVTNTSTVGAKYSGESDASLFNIKSMTMALWDSPVMKKYDGTNDYGFVTFSGTGTNVNFNSPSDNDKKTLKVTLTTPGSNPLSNYETSNSVIFAITNSSHSFGQWSSCVSQEFDLKYIFHFGKDPNSFASDWTGPEPTPITLELPTNTSTTAEVDFSSILTELPGVKYARFYLVRNDEPQELSATAITVTSGQTPTDPTCGVYLYTGSAFTSETDLRVTVNIPSSAAGTIEDYRLVAYFSDEDPQTYSGTTVTKEPATLDIKKIYKFSYPIVKKDKYIDWNTNITTIDLASYLSTDFPTLTSSSTKGYIGWSIYDGPYGSSNPVNIQGNYWNPPVAPNWAMVLGGDVGDTKTTFSVSDAEISSKWTGYTKPTVYAPGTQKFEDFPNHIVVAEVSDESSDKIRVRYIFHFNADGLEPYDLVNETAITDTKKAVPTTDYEAANKVFDVSDALVSGAKYARVYVAKYGNPIEESANLTVTYDGAALTQCAAGNVKFGWYLSEAGGIDPSKLSITGLDAAEMLKYELVIVSANEELSGTKEPAWQKKTVIYLQKDIRNRVLAANDAETITLNFQDNILTTQLGGASVSDFSKSLYAKWYILDPT